MFHLVTRLFELWLLHMLVYNFNISIYPNPVYEGYINISNTSNNAYDIEIFDMNGRKILSKKSVFDSIDVTMLSEGIYNLKLSFQGNISYKKVVIK